jgi:hypothetical protein
MGNDRSRHDDLLPDRGDPEAEGQAPANARDTGDNGDWIEITASFQKPKDADVRIKLDVGVVDDRSDKNDKN